jgi:glycosyltransferase involved in cell wall biosynthesis
MHALARLGAYLEALPNDKNTIAHIHSMSMGLSSSIAVALKRHGIPYVITAHDAGWACPNGCYYNFQRHLLCSLKPLSAGCISTNCDKQTYAHKAYKLLKSGVLDYVSGLKNGASVMFVPSSLLHDKIIGRMPKETRLRILQNPVNVQDLGQKRQPGGHFLFVGRLMEEKGVNELLNAIAGRFPLIIVGEGPMLEGLQSKYPDVLFKGWLAPDAVQREMRAARAVILSSIYLEAFGLVVPEALALGTPAIVSNRAGSRAMIEHGVNGFVVDMDEPQKLQAACTALSDDLIAARMSVQAYTAYWRNPMTTQRYIDALMQVYQEVIAGSFSGASVLSP